MRIHTILNVLRLKDLGPLSARGGGRYAYLDHRSTMKSVTRQLFLLDVLHDNNTLNASLS
jgi:hypothetical protein